MEYLKNIIIAIGEIELRKDIYRHAKHDTLPYDSNFYFHASLEIPVLIHHSTIKRYGIKKCMNQAKKRMIKCYHDETNVTRIVFDESFTFE